MRSNNTNKLSPQERVLTITLESYVQIIQINLVLKNPNSTVVSLESVQIIQINLVLKNIILLYNFQKPVQIIQINLVLKNGLSNIVLPLMFK